ncbi:MAG: N-6 DNA methylase, partial [Planctomycetaceae bacterium]|nr:N-6 DNA methylase [Planctomycetaceae bacterium]
EEVGKQFYLEIRNWFYWVTQENEKIDGDYAMRLVVRLLFCFFLREKNELVPKELLNSDILKHLKSDEEYSYYNGILRNLFFHCLNAAQGERKYENEKLLADKKNIRDWFSAIPFLNGGLFDEHDKDDIPIGNDYFFSEKKVRLLTELGEKCDVYGLITILSKYKYKLTLDDLLDQTEYSETVDPEFIGKVFESLLSCIDADSKESRRKVTGSYYTPREIVDYMVNEALDAYLEQSRNRKIAPEQSQSYDCGSDLLQCKILDPACGSGAFPCEAMNIIVHRIEEDQKEKENKGLSSSERYRTKLKIIRDVIFGVDIQPMAVQITLLRFFLSLIQDIVPDKRKANYGIEPLPNLETKFVCADALIGLQKRNGQGLLESRLVRETTKQLRETRRQHFMASHAYEKQRLRQYDETLRKTLVMAMEEAFTDDATEKLAAWDPYDQFHSASFFDPMWMFGIQDGFDIVIGNPPYVFARNSQFKGMTKEVKAYFYNNYALSEYQINLYPLFIEKGTNLLKNDGILCFITPNNWLTLNTNKKLRQFILKQADVAITNFYKKVFASADVDAAIVLFRKNNKSTTGKIKLGEWRKKYTLTGEIEKDKILSGKDCVINVEAIKGNGTFPLLEKIERCGTPLSEIAVVKAGLKAYETGKGMPPQTEEMKRNRIYHSNKKEDESFIRYLEGKDVCRYSCGWSGEYLKFGKNLAAQRQNFDIFSTPRILVRQIPSPLPYCINACFIEETILNDLNSMNIIYIKVSPFYLLGILNSRVISYWFAHKFGKLQRGIFPQFKINELAQFPIPNVAPDKQRPIITLVEKILSAKQTNPQANTSGLERKIDKLVYALYGLTEEEIALVEGQS